MHPLAPILAELTPLLHERGSQSPFHDHTAFLRWADTVEPLLAFDTNLSNEFSGNVHSAKLLLGWREGKYDGAVNEAIGTLNKAVTLLRVRISQEDKPPVEPVQLPQVEAPSPALLPPERLTLKWVYEHAPWQFYVSFAGILSLVFAAGFSASEIRTAMNSNPFKQAAPTITAPTSSSTAAPATKASSSVTASSPK